jgi:DedD protein
MMDDGLKKRLIGAAVLASLAAIFVPMLFEEPPTAPPSLPPLPSPPPQRDFASEMLSEEVPAVVPLTLQSVDDPVTEMPDDEPPMAPNTEDAQRTGLSAWVVQAASLSSRDNAERLVKRLRAADLPTPDPELVDIKGKRYYRVKVGPVIERAEAESMLDKVSEIAGAKAQVRRYP